MEITFITEKVTWLVSTAS